MISLKVFNPAFFIAIFIIAFATSPEIFLLNDKKNIFVIALMAISPVVLLFSKKIYRLDIWLFLFIVSIFLSPLLNHPESLRWSTMFYTFMFGLTFIAYEHLLYKNYFTIDKYLLILKSLIFTYFIILLLQQLCVLTGLPIFLAGNYHPEDPWKLSSISSEPSIAALNLTIMLYSFITIKELLLKRAYSLRTDFKDDKWVWIAFLWYMLTSHSASALLLLILFFLKFMTFRNFLFLFILGTVSIFALSFLELPIFERASKFFAALLTFDPKQIMEADHSGSYRFVPTMIMFEKANISTLDGWFGYGIDYVSTFLYLAMPGTIKGYSTGGIMIVCLEYGFLAFMLFIIFSLSAVYRKRTYMDIMFWFIFLFLGNGINTQLFWLGIILLFTNKYFYKQNDSYSPLKNKNITLNGAYQ